MSSLTPEAVINASLAADVVKHGGPAAATQFRDAHRSAIKVCTVLSGPQLARVKSQVSVPCVFQHTSPVISDHPEMCALREVIRHVHGVKSGASKIALNTLCIGATAREISLYDDNVAISFYIGYKDAKDVERVVIKGLNLLHRRLDKAASSTERRLRRKKTSLTQSPCPKRVRCNKIQDMLWDMNTVLYGKGTRIFFQSMPSADVLLLEDCCYEFSPSDYLQMFKDTGAKVAYGYGLLPLELVFPDMPANKMYTVNTGFGESTLTYKSEAGGYATGYCHPTAAWETILRYPAIQGRYFKDRCGLRFGFDLHLEITGRAGPMASFTITRGPPKLVKVVRQIALPAQDEYVRVLDPERSIDQLTGRPKAKLTYFSMFAKEYHDLLNFMVALSPSSLKPGAAATYIRRRARGVALVGKELETPWRTPDYLWYTVACVATVHAMLLSDKMQEWVSTLTERAGIKQWFKDVVCRGMSAVAGGFILSPLGLYDVLKKNAMLDKLVLQMDSSKYQFVRTTVEPSLTRGQGSFDPVERDDDGSFTYDTILGNLDRIECPVCDHMNDKLGLQTLACNHKRTIVNMKLTGDQLDGLRVKFSDTDRVPAGLAAVMERACKNVPASGFSHDVTVHYIRGGPGCGKSYFIRKMATEHDLVLAPFSKLRTDYMSVTLENGDTVDLPFKTQHRGFETRGFSRIFVDEFMSFPYDHLMAIAYLNQASEIYLVGDELQTGVRESDEEGLNILNHLDITSLGKHELCRNFRNPAPIVGYLNKRYGYNMESMSGTDGVLDIVPIEDVADMISANGKPIKVLAMGFSRATCSAYDLGDCTVRACQGADEEVAILYVTRHDGKLLDIESLQIVGLSRHKYRLIVAHDNSDLALTWIAKMDLHNIMDYKQYCATHAAGTDAVVSVNDPVVERWCATTDARSVTAISPTVTASSGFDLPDEPKLTDDIWFDASDHTIFEDSDRWFDAEQPTMWCDTSFNPEEIPLEGGLSSILVSLGAVIRVTVDAEVVPFKLVNHDSTSNRLEVSFPRSCLPKTAVVCIVLYQETHYRHIRYGFSSILAAISVMHTGAHEGAKFDTEYVPGGDLRQLEPDFEEHAMAYVPFSRNPLLEVPKLEEPNLPGPKNISPLASDEIVDSLLPDIAVFPEGESLNQTTSAAVPDNFSNGQIGCELLNPVNLRGNPKPMVDRYFQYAQGSGLHFGRNKPMQTLATIQARYAGKDQRSYKLDEPGVKLAQQIANRAIGLCCNIPDAFDDVEGQAVIEQFVAASAQKNYEKQYIGIDNPDINIIRFENKPTYKPNITNLTEQRYAKVGQGISAWNKDLQIHYGNAIRILNARFKACLKPNIIFDNRESEQAIRTKMMNNFDRVPDVAKFAVGDWTQMDACQNRFTQLIERCMIKQLGFGEEFCESYYRYRNDYRLVFSGGQVKARSAKTSGEPGTLLFNTMLSLAITLAVVEFDGEFALAMKGDDTLLRAMNVRRNIPMLMQLERYFSLGFKLDVAGSADFCGNAIFGDLVAPNIVRKLHKTTAHRFRSYDHFCEYQISLRDWVSKLYADPRLTEIFHGNALVNKCGVAEVEHMFDALVSFSHYGKQQFDEHFIYREEVMNFMGANGAVEI